LEDHDTLPKGGESFVYVSYFIKLKGALQPSAHTPEGADGSRDGIYLAVIELRNAPMEAIGETAAGFKIPFKSSTLCYLLIVDYYSYE